jgi:hypothetical protein
MKMLELQQRFTNDLEELGPNYAAVFNFWAFVDTLSDEQKNLIVTEFRNSNICGYERRIVDCAEKVIDDEYHIWQEVFKATNHISDFAIRQIITWATHELICMHELIADGEPIVFLPLFDCAWDRLK